MFNWKLEPILKNPSDKKSNVENIDVKDFKEVYNKFIAPNFNKAHKKEKYIWQFRYQWYRITITEQRFWYPTVWLFDLTNKKYIFTEAWLYYLKDYFIKNKFSGFENDKRIY